jgi:glutathione S-transferase
VSGARTVLYGPRGLPLVEKAGRGLRLKRLDFDRVEPTSPEDYARLSPETGLLPVLEIDGRRIPDSRAILDFLDERFPEPPLASADPRVAREQRSLEIWIDETFAFYMLRWVRSRIGPAALPSAPGGGFPLGSLSRLGLIDAEGRLTPDVFAASDGGPGPEFDRRLDDLDQLLGARPFFFADQLSRADLSVCGSLSALARDVYAGARTMLAARPRLLAHVERVLAATGGVEPV